MSRGRLTAHNSGPSRIAATQSDFLGPMFLMAATLELLDVGVANVLEFLMNSDSGGVIAFNGRLFELDEKDVQRTPGVVFVGGCAVEPLRERRGFQLGGEERQACAPVLLHVVRTVGHDQVRIQRYLRFMRAGRMVIGR